MLLKTVNLRAFLTAAIERNKRISHAPTRVNFSAFDFAVLTAIYCHLVCKNCVTVFSLREVYRSVSHKSGIVALLSLKKSHEIEESIKKFTQSYVVVRIGRRQECLSLLPTEIRTERIFGAMTKAVCLKECPPFLIFAIEHDWLATDKVPFSFHQHMQATRKQISISFIIDYIIADELEKLDVADDYEVQVEIPYTIIYNAANDVAVHRLPKKKYYSPTYCNRVRKVVHGLLDELKDLGFSPSGKNISIIYVGGITSLQKLVFSRTRLSFEEYQLGTLLILSPQLKRGIILPPSLFAGTDNVNLNSSAPLTVYSKAGGGKAFEIRPRTLCPRSNFQCIGFLCSSVKAEISTPTATAAAFLSIPTFSSCCSGAFSSSVTVSP